MMKTIGQVLGAIGLVFLLTTPVMYFAVGAGWNWLFTVQLILGGAFILACTLTNLGEVSRVATGRGTFYVAFTAVSSLAVLGLLVAGNYLAYSSDLRLDLTKARIFTLAPDSVNTVNELPEPVEVLAFFRSDTPQYQHLEELVSRYRRAGGAISIQAVDPDREPEKVREYNIHLRGNRVVVRMGEMSERLSDLSEEALTNALLRLTRGAGKRVYFTTGHGESGLDDDHDEQGLGLARMLMENEGLEAVPLRITGSIPEDAAAVVVAGPRRAFLEPEVELLSDYLEGGGRLMVLLEPMAESGLEDFLESWGIGVEDDLVVDQNQVTELMGPFVTASASYAQHEITEAFDAMLTLFPTARSLIALDIEDVKRPTPLVLTGREAWGSKAYRRSPITYEPETDRRGPLPLAVVAEKETKGGAWSPQARLLVFGDTDFATNAWARQAANSDLFLNSINWMAGQVERITIRPRHRPASQIILTEEQRTFLSMFSINILPLLLASMGVAVWVLRKNR